MLHLKNLIVGILLLFFTVIKEVFKNYVNIPQNILVFTQFHTFTCPLKHKHNVQFGIPLSHIHERNALQYVLTPVHGIFYPKSILKFTLEQAMKAQRGKRGIALFIV